MDGGRVSRAALLATVSYLAVAVMAPRPALAEVRTDGTLGRRVRLQGGDITIGADLGQQRGGNLFHSFEKFDVETGGRVTFTGPDSVKNVIGRVTGGDPSSIDGTLASSIPDADLYLLNPAGILFGPTAQLDVKGSFHASTAEELRFGDGAVFSALDMDGSTLSVAEPQSFGFLEARSGTIALSGAFLYVSAGKHLSLSGLTVDLSDGAVVGADGGRITLAGMDQGTLQFASATVTEPFGGSVHLDRGSIVDAGGEGGGKVELRGREVVLSGSSEVLATNLGGIDASGGVDVAALRLQLSGGSAIAAEATYGSGRGGTVRIAANEVSIVDTAQISSSTFGRANAGSVDVTAARLIIDGAGELAIPVDGVATSARGGIFSQAVGFDGAAGSIRVSATDLELRAGGVISSSSLSDGNGGTVDVKATRLLIDGARLAFYTGIGSVTLIGQGDGGDVRVAAVNLELRDGGAISSGSNAFGSAGRVEVTAGVLEMRGKGSEISSGTELTHGGAAAGDLKIQTNVLRVENGLISTEGLGLAGGRIDISASDLIYLRRSEVTTNGIQARDGTSVISLTAPRIILNNSDVTSITGTGPVLEGSGEATLNGRITLISTDSLVAGSSSVQVSGLQTNLGSDLQISPSVFLDAASLLMPSCANRGAARSTFSRGGRGGLPPAPDRPLPSAGAEPPAAVRATDARPIFLDLCAGSLVPATKS